MTNFICGWSLYLCLQLLLCVYLIINWQSFSTHIRNIITSFWYISQALGTLLNAGIAQIPMSLTYELFVYMILMVAVTVLFVVINRNYWYRKVAPSTEETTTEGS